VEDRHRLIEIRNLNGLRETVERMDELEKPFVVECSKLIQITKRRE
jgi:hypothetical protein